jgi:hypothetical protein
MPLKHIQMCAPLVSARQLVQIRPSAPYTPSKHRQRCSELVPRGVERKSLRRLQLPLKL